MRVLIILMFHRFEPLVAKDYCRYKPVGIQAYGIKYDYSEVPLETLGNMDFSTEDTNGADVKVVSDVKKENETFSRKLSFWLSKSSNADSKANPNQTENSLCPTSKNSTPVESIVI